VLPIDHRGNHAAAGGCFDLTGRQLLLQSLHFLLHKLRLFHDISQTLRHIYLQSLMAR
jgi:hypothetical protein